MWAPKGWRPPGWESLLEARVLLHQSLLPLPDTSCRRYNHRWRTITNCNPWLRTQTSNDPELPRLCLSAPSLRLFLRRSHALHSCAIHCYMTAPTMPPASSRPSGVSHMWPLCFSRLSHPWDGIFHSIYRMSLTFLSAEAMLLQWSYLRRTNCHANALDGEQDGSLINPIWKQTCGCVFQFGKINCTQQQPHHQQSCVFGIMQMRLPSSCLIIKLSPFEDFR